MAPLLLVIGLGGMVEFGLRFVRSRRSSVQFWGAWQLPSPKALSFRNHPYALYVKTPNADGLYPSNSLGYSGKREFSMERHPNSVRIYCVGGSTTEGHVPSQGPDSSWPGQVQDILARRFPHTTIECINAGTAGYTSAESLAEFIFRGIDLKPDLLLVYHNINDVLTCQMVEGFKTDYSHVRCHKPWTIGWINRIPQCPSWWTYQAVWNWLTMRYGKINALLYWISDPPWSPVHDIDERAVYAFRRNITVLATVARRWACTPVLIKWECSPAGDEFPSYLEHNPNTDELCRALIQANNDGLQQIASQVEGCQYLDVGPFEPRHFETDGMHFSPQGLGEMASRVANGIEPLVRSIVELQRSPVDAVSSPGAA